MQADAAAPICFKVPRELKNQVDEVVRKRDISMTRLVIEYFQNLVKAEKAATDLRVAHGQRPVEVVLLMNAELSAALNAEAGRQQTHLNQFLYNLLCNAVGRDEGTGPVNTGNYSDFAKLVDCVRKAYEEDRSPVDSLLEIYPSLASTRIPMGQLFTEAIAAVPIDQVVSQRIMVALKQLHQRKAGSH